MTNQDLADKVEELKALPKPKYKIGDKVRVDGFDDAVISKVGIFKKNKRIYVAYQLKENILSGFWAEEDRIKLK